MRLIKAKQLPGFSLEWLNIAVDGSISDEVQQTLAAAANGLVARGYLSPAKKPSGSEPLTVSMPSPLIALVGAAAFSDYTILLSLQHTPDGPLMLYLHGFLELGVIHSTPFPGIHQFEAVEGQANMVRVMNDVLHLRSQLSSKLPAGDVPVTAMESARGTIARGEMNQAQDLLLNAGLAAETANALAKAMVNASVMGAVIISSRNADSHKLIHKGDNHNEDNLVHRQKRPLAGTQR